MTVRPRSMMAKPSRSTFADDALEIVGTGLAKQVHASSPDVIDVEEP